MKYIIEFGISILLLAAIANNLSSVVKKARKGQLIILKESTASSWGRVWIPK